MAGLLDFDSPLQQFGLGLLSAGGPSRVPINFGQALGMGMQQAADWQSRGAERELRAMQMDQLRAQMAAQAEDRAIKQAQREAMGQLLNSDQLPDAVRMRLRLGGDPDKAFDAFDQAQVASQIGQALAPRTVAGPRPHQGQVSGNFDLSSPEKQKTLLADLEKLEKTDPQEAARVYEALIEQGALPAPTVQQQPGWQDIARTGATIAASGRKGGTELLKMAEMMQPNTMAVDTGNGVVLIDKNTGQPVGNRTLQKGMSPEAAARLGLDWQKLATDREQFDRTLSKPVYQDGAFVYPPSAERPGGAVQTTSLFAPPKGSAASQAKSAEKALALIDEAEKILPRATGSYLGAGVDAAAAAFGGATPGAQAAAQLKAIEGALMMAQPRMEGPQSNLDVALYERMAGMIGDATVPVNIRRSALQTIRTLHEKYAGSDGAKSGQQQPDLAAQAADELRRRGVR